MICTYLAAIILIPITPWIWWHKKKGAMAGDGVLVRTICLTSVPARFIPSFIYHQVTRILQTFLLTNIGLMPRDGRYYNPWCFGKEILWCSALCKLSLMVMKRGALFPYWFCHLNPTSMYISPFLKKGDHQCSLILQYSELIWPPQSVHFHPDNMRNHEDSRHFEAIASNP